MNNFAEQPHPLPEDFSVNIEREGIFDLKDLHILYRDILQYNEAHTLGKVIARGLSGLLMPDEDEERVTSPQQMLDRLAKEAGLTALQIRNRYDTIVQKLGMELRITRSGASIGIFESEEGENLEEGAIGFEIVEPNRFIRFLSSLDPDQIQRTGTHFILSYLSNCLRWQIMREQDFYSEEPSDKTFEILASLQTMCIEFKRLKISDGSVDVLEQFAMHYDIHDFREYLYLFGSNLLAEGYFGPDIWHTDTTIEGFNERWDKALRMLRFLKTSPELQSQLRIRLQQSILLALEDIDRLLLQPPPDYGQIMTLQKQEEQKKLWSDELEQKAHILTQVQEQL